MQSVTDFYDLLRQYISDNTMYIFVVIAWVTIMKQLSGKYKGIYVLITIMLIVLLFNPISFFLLGMKLGYKATYYRFLWLIPCMLLWGYVVYELVRRVDNIRARLFLVMTICALVIGTNVSIKEMKLPENVYQISTEVLGIAEEIENIMKNKGEEKSVILADTQISNVIRQYNASICLPFEVYSDFDITPELKDETCKGLMAMLMFNRNDISKTTIQKIVEENEIEYLVILTENEISIQYMQEMNWKICAKIGTYSILEQ